MHPVDTLVCFNCKKEERVLSSGKSSRRLEGVCEKCQPELFPNEETKDESPAKSRSVSPGK